MIALIVIAAVILAGLGACWVIGGLLGIYLVLRNTKPTTQTTTTNNQEETK